MKENSLLISIIVPVYNVEVYLNRCIESLIKQTYSNIEIILVDDGSTDSSGEICDYYAEKYEFIKVLHKENGGLSEARNYAVPYIHGQFVSFVDSDDYVDKEYIGCMVEQVVKNSADFVATGYVDEDETGIILKKYKFSNSIILMNSEEAIERMCYQIDFGTSAWGKLISVELVKKYLFPKGKLYEDLATIYKMLGDSKVIVYLDRATYHYIQRLGSIRHTSWSPRIMDVMEATTELLDYIEQNYPSCMSAGIQRYYFSANEVFVRAFNEDNYIDIINPIRKKLIAMWKLIRANNKIGLIQKIRYFLMAFHPIIYCKLWRLLKGE